VFKELRQVQRGHFCLKTRLFKRFKIFEGQFSGFRATTDAAAAGNVDDGDQESPGINVIELYL
jgi:hypothetical protein